MLFLTAAYAAPVLSIDLSTGVSAAPIIITALLSGMATLRLLALRREILYSDAGETPRG